MLPEPTVKLLLNVGGVALIVTLLLQVVKDRVRLAYGLAVPPEANDPVAAIVRYRFAMSVAAIVLGIVFSEIGQLITVATVTPEVLVAGFLTGLFSGITSAGVYEQASNISDFIRRR